jgi:hypothetical protein
MTADEYRRNAAECVAMAMSLTDPGKRTRLLEIAQAWATLAEQAERNAQTDIVYETPPPRREEKA